MDTSEKRYFQLNTKMHEGEKDYQLLFDLIRKSDMSADSIKIKFKAQKPDASFEITCSHLYHLILDKLLMRDTEKEVEQKVIRAYLESKFLFRRSLHDDAFQLIEKYKAIALEYELFGPFLMLAKLEIKFYNQLEFSHIDENHLLKLQAKIESVSRQQRSIENHTGLYNLISIMQFKHGMIRNETEKEKLNDLALNESQVVSGQTKNSFEAQKLNLLFQSAYFMKTVNPKSSLKVYYELNELFENNQKLWGTPPYFYLNHLKGTLNNLRWFGRYNEMQFYIDKMKALLVNESTGKDFIQNLVFLFESLTLTDQKKYTEALLHLEKQDQSWIQKISSLSFASRIEFVLQSATVYFWNKKYKKALKIIQPILNIGKPFLEMPLIKTIRFLNILIHYELEDFDYLESEIRSFERDLVKQSKLYKSEKIILKGIKQCCKGNELRKNAKTVRTQVEKLYQLKTDPFENQLLKTFGFIEWFETTKS
jgi:hypothetical protein